MLLSSANPQKAREDDMANLKLSFSCWNYDRMRALMDGTVKPEGIDLNYERCFRRRPSNVRCTKGIRRLRDGPQILSRTLHMDDPPFIAIPVFPVRLFRHSAIYVNTKGGIQSPQDLIGRRSASSSPMATTRHWAAASWPTNMACRRTRTPITSAASTDRPRMGVVSVPPPDIKVENLGPDQTLDAMLEAARSMRSIPRSRRRPSSGRGKVRRLFEEYEAVERDYYRKTGIFPIMHIVVVRTRPLSPNPWIAQSLYQALKEAKAAPSRR